MDVINARKSTLFFSKTRSTVPYPSPQLSLLPWAGDGLVVLCREFGHQDDYSFIHLVGKATVRAFATKAHKS